MPSNDSIRVLEGFLAALLRHHGETSCCVDTSCMDQTIRPTIKVNLIIDNCAIHQTKPSIARKTSSGCNLRSLSFEKPPFALEEARLAPRRLCRNDGEKRDTSPLMPRSHKKKIQNRIEEQEHSIEIPKQSLHQSWTTSHLASTIIPDRSCPAEATAVAAAEDICKSRWLSSCPMTRNANFQRPFTVEHDVHKTFPTPPHPAKRQVSIDSHEENCGPILSSCSSSRQLVVIDLAEDEESMMQEHAPKSLLPNKDCNVIELVDQALHTMANSFPDAVPRDRTTPYRVMKCHHRSHSLVALCDTKWR